MRLSGPGPEAGPTVVSGTTGTMPHAMIKTVVCAKLSFAQIHVRKPGFLGGNSWGLPYKFKPRDPMPRLDGAYGWNGQM